MSLHFCTVFPNFMNHNYLKDFYSLSQFKKDNLWVWQLDEQLWSFFCQMHIYFLQNLIADGYFEVLNMLKLNYIKSYKRKQKKICFYLFQFWKKKYWKFMSHKWPFFDRFGSFFFQLHENLLQNWGPDGHFEVLSMSKS